MANAVRADDGGKFQENASSHVKTTFKEKYEISLNLKVRTRICVPTTRARLFSYDTRVLKNMSEGKEIGRASFATTFSWHLEDFLAWVSTIPGINQPKTRKIHLNTCEGFVTGAVVYLLFIQDQTDGTIRDVATDDLSAFLSPHTPSSSPLIECCDCI